MKRCEMEIKEAELSEMNPMELWDVFFYGACPYESVSGGVLAMIARYIDEPDNYSLESDIDQALEGSVWAMLRAHEEVNILNVSDVPDYVPGRIARYMFESIKGSLS